MAKKSLFGKKAPAPPALPVENININNRLRLVEEKTTNLNRKIEVIEKNMLDHFKKTTQDFKTFDKELMDFKHEINALKEKADLIIKELRMTAGKDELNTLKKYLDLWSPVKFITREEVEKIIQDKLEQKNL